MKQYILIFEYNSKEFMNVNKIIEFSKNLEKLKKENKTIKMVFYGEISNEEMATFMSYFNALLKQKVCDISISFTTKEIVVENGINNKSIKLSAKNAKEVKNKKFDNLIKEYYSNFEDINIKILPNKNWQSLILDFID